VLGYIGRQSPWFWKHIAPLFTASRIKRWIRSAGPRIVNLGGGANVFDRWLTADIDPRADVYVDITAPLPFVNDCVDAIFLEEVVEHIPVEAARRLLGECHRILRPGGVLRLTTPDLDAFTASNDGSVRAADAINAIFYEHQHRHIYGRSGVLALLEAAGFAHTVRSSFRDASSRYGYFDTHALRYSMSETELTQYWEASKSG
jgi:predicted SAM-dependent methyltransferase